MTGKLRKKMDTSCPCTLAICLLLIASYRKDIYFLSRYVEPFQTLGLNRPLIGPSWIYVPLFISTSISIYQIVLKGIYLPPESSPMTITIHNNFEFCLGIILYTM